MADDGFKPIETLRVGDLLAAKDEATGKIDFKPISKLHIYTDRPYYALTLKAADKAPVTLTVTADHPFYVIGQGWTNSKALTIGDKLASYADGSHEVVSWQALNQTGTTFNFDVADYHSYFVSSQNVWVHNGGPCDLKPKDRIKTKDVTEPKSRVPNYEVDKTRSEFEKHLVESGFDKQSVSTGKGDINIFSKNGKKEFTTRGFAKSTGEASGEIFSGGKKASAKIRFMKE